LGSRLGKMTGREVASAFNVPVRTARRWLALWRAAGVRGIELVPSKIPGREAFRVHPSVVARWKRGALPVPHESALPRAA